MHVSTGWHIWACACLQMAWDAERKVGEKELGSQVWGGYPEQQASHRPLGSPLPSASSSAADAGSQDPDSTDPLESEAPRDYFLKCK